MIGVCANLDQYLNMTAVERAGAGVVVRSGRLSPAALRRVVRRVLGDDDIRRRAGELAWAIAGYDVAQRFRAAIASVRCRPYGLLPG